MYNPYGNQRQSQGPYGANLNPDHDPRMGTSNMGLPFNTGTSAAANPLSSPPMFSQQMSYRPEPDRTMDLQLRRDEPRHLNTPLSQPSSQMTSQRDDLYCPFTSTSSYSGSSSAARPPPTASNSDSNVNSSLNWLLKLTRSTSAEPRPSSFPSSSNFLGGGDSSTPFQSVGDSQFKRSEGTIPGLGDYTNTETPFQRKDPPATKYSAETATNILRHFNLEKEDLEELISYPENEITPENLPHILRQIRIEKNRKAAATSSSSYNDPSPARPGFDSSSWPDSKQSKVMDYGHKDLPGSAKDISLPKQSTTIRVFSNDIPPIPNKVDLDKDKSPVLQPSKVIEYGHTGKYITGAGTESGTMGAIARAIQGIMKVDTSFTRETFPSTATASTPAPARPVPSVGSKSQDKSSPADTFSVPFPSMFSSATSELREKRSTKQGPTTEKSFNLPKQDTDLRQHKTDQFKEKGSDVSPLSKLPPQSTQAVKKSGVIIVDSGNKLQSKIDVQKPDLPALHQTKTGHVPNVSHVSSQFVPRNTDLRTPPAPVNQIPTLSSNATGRPTIVPPAPKQPVVKPMQTKVPPKNKGNLAPLPSTFKPQAKVTPALVKIQALKGVPSTALMQDYAAASPRSFPHTCCLCHKECPHMKDWITHQNSSFHIQNCKHLRQRYPDWDGEVPSRLACSSPTSRNARRSRSRSSSPRRHHGSERRDKRRSRTRSPLRRTKRSRSASPPSSSRRPHSRSRSRERRESPLSRMDERRRDDKLTSPKRERRLSPRRVEDRRVSPRRNDDRRQSPKKVEERRNRSSPPRSRERRYSPQRYTPPRYSPSRYTPPRGHDLRVRGEREEQRSLSRSSRETRSSSDKRSTNRPTNRPTAQKRKPSELELTTKKMLEKSSVLKSLSGSADMDCLVETMMPLLMSRLAKEMGTSAASPTASPTAAKKKVVKKTVLTPMKKTVFAASKPSAVKPSTMVRLGSIIPPLSHDDVVAFAEQFGKTKSVLLFRQKHQAVVCFDKEDDAKKLRNAKDLQIKDHQVTIVKYKEAVSTSQRKSPVTAARKPVKSAIKTTATTSKTSVSKATPAKATMSKATATKTPAAKPTQSKTTSVKTTTKSVKSATVSKAPTVPKPVARKAPKPPVSQTTTSTATTDVTAAKTATTTTASTTSTITTSTTISTIATIVNAAAQAVVVTKRKATAFPSMRSVQYSSLKEVVIQDDSLPSSSKEVSNKVTNVPEAGGEADGEANNEAIKTPDVNIEPIEISSGTDCEDEQLSKALKNASEATEEASVKMDDDKAEEKLVTEEKTSDETVESKKNMVENSEKDHLKNSEEVKEVIREKIPCQGTVGSAKNIEQNLQIDDSNVTKEKLQQDPKSVQEKDTILTAKNDAQTLQQEMEQVVNQQSENLPQKKSSPSAEAAMEKNDLSEETSASAQGETVAEEGEEKMEVSNTEAEKVQETSKIEVIPEITEEKPESKPELKPESKPEAKLTSKTTPNPPRSSPSPSVELAEPSLTMGETLDQVLTPNTFKKNSLTHTTVFGPKFLMTERNLVILSNLPKYDPQKPYTEEELVKKLTPFGFRHEPHNIYIIPQCKMAFVTMPNSLAVLELVKAFVRRPHPNAMFRRVQLKPQVPNERIVVMAPAWFYWSVTRMCKYQYDNDGERLVFITGISDGDAAELRKKLEKIGSVKNYLPLLNRVFVEFDSSLDADRLGVYHSLLNRTPSYEIIRMQVPSCKLKTLPPSQATRAVPDSSERAPGVATPGSSFGIPFGSNGPFWVTMTTKPFFYPTCAPWFIIPDFKMLLVRKNPYQRFQAFNKRTIMLTHLPLGDYTHEDVAKLVWTFLLRRNLHCLYYDIIVLPLQRRAFINFYTEKCAQFAEKFFYHGLTLKGTLLQPHYVDSSLFPLSSEEEMYATFMTMSNNRAPEVLQLGQRLLCVFVTEVSLDVFRLVIEVITSAAPILGFLPLANRICVEMPDVSDVVKVKEKFSTYKPEVDWKKELWSKVLHLETSSELKQRIMNSGNTVVCLDQPPVPALPEKSTKAEAKSNKEESNTTLMTDKKTPNDEKEKVQCEDTTVTEEKADQANQATAKPEPEKPDTKENNQNEMPDPSPSSVPLKGQDLKTLTTAVCEHKQNKPLSSDSEQEDRKSQTSEDSASHRVSSRDFPFEDLSDLVMVDEISDEKEETSSSRHHRHLSSSSSRRSSYLRRDCEKSSSSSDRHQTSSLRSSRESTKHSSAASSSSRSSKDCFKSPSSSSSSSPKKPIESSKSPKYHSSSSSSRSSSSRDKHSDKSDRYCKDKAKESEVAKPGHKGSDKSSSKLQEKETKSKQSSSSFGEAIKNNVDDLKDKHPAAVGGEGYEIIDAVEDQNENESYQVLDSIDEVTKMGEEGVELDESFHVLDSVTEEQVNKEPTEEKVEEGPNQEMDSSKSESASENVTNLKPETRSKRKREDDVTETQDVCSKTAKRDDQEGDEQETFEILDSIEDQTIIDEAQNVEDVPNDKVLEEKDHFKASHEVDDRSKLDTESKKSEAASTRSTRSGRLPRSEEKEQTTKKTQTRAKQVLTVSKIEEEIVEFKVVDSVEEEPTKQEISTRRRSCRGTGEQRDDILDSIKDSSSKQNASTRSTRERSSRSVKTNSSSDGKTHKDDSRHGTRDCQEKAENKTSKNLKESATDLKRGAFEILDSVEEETTAISEKSTRGKTSKNESLKSDSSSDERSRKDDSRHRTRRSRERSEDKGTADAKEENSAHMESGTFEILDSVEEETVTISEKLMPSKESTPSKSRKTSVRDSQEAKPDGSEVMYKVIDLIEEDKTRSSRQTRSSQRDLFLNLPQTGNTPTRRGRTLAREAKQENLAMELLDVEVQEAIEEEFEILDAVEEEPMPLPKARRGRPRKPPQKTARDEKVQTPNKKEGNIQESEHEKQNEQAISMEISEESFPKKVEEEEDEPIYEVLDSLEEDQFQNEQMVCAGEVTETLVEKSDKCCLETTEAKEKPIEDTTINVSDIEKYLAEVRTGQAKDKSVESQKEIVENQKDDSENSFFEQKSSESEVLEQSGSSSNQPSNEADTSEVAILEAEKTERQTTRTTRSTRSGKVCLSEEISPKQRMSRRNETKQGSKSESPIEDDKEVSKTDKIVESKSAKSVILKLDEVSDEEFQVLDSIEEVESKEEAQIPPPAAKRKGRPRKQSKKTASKSGNIKADDRSTEDRQESNIEQNKMNCVSEMQEMAKSEIVLEEMAKTEDEEPIYEVVDAVEEDQVPGEECSDVIAKTDKFEDLVPKYGQPSEEDKIASEINKEEETIEKKDMEAQTPSPAAKKKGRPCKQSKKTASKSSNVKADNQSTEDRQESNIEQDKINCGSEMQEMTKSEIVLDEIAKTEDEEPIYEVVDAVEDQVPGEECSDVIAKTDKFEDLAPKYGQPSEEDNVGSEISKEEETIKKKDVKEVKDAAEFQNKLTENAGLREQNLETTEAINNYVLNKSEEDTTGQGTTKVKNPLESQTTSKDIVDDVQVAESVDDPATITDTKSEIPIKVEETSEEKATKTCELVMEQESETYLDDFCVEAKDKNDHNKQELAAYSSVVQVLETETAEKTKQMSKKVDMNLEAVSDGEDFPDFDDDGLVVLDEFINEEEEEEGEGLRAEEELCVKEEGSRAEAEELSAKEGLRTVEQNLCRKEDKQREGEQRLLEEEVLCKKEEELRAEEKGQSAEVQEPCRKEDEQRVGEERVPQGEVLCKKEEELKKEREELKKDVPEPLVQEDQRETAKPDSFETQVEAVEEMQERETSKSVKRKHEENEEIPNFVMVDEVRKVKEGGEKRKTPAPNDEVLEEGRTELTEGEVQPGSSADSGVRREDCALSVELHTETKTERARELSVELGVEMDHRVGSKRRTDVEGPNSKRSRSQSPSVSSDTKIPPFRPNTPLGQQFVVPKSGFFCDLCSLFYLNESMARQQHCSSRRHYDNVKKYFERQSRGASQL